MRTIILGGGVIGVTTAYELAKEGHEVTVLERQSSAAAETSYANAGLIAPGHATAWASPSAPVTLLKSLVRDDTALRLRFTIDPRMWLWGIHFLRNCTTARNRANTLAKLRLCFYSQEALKALRGETGIAYEALTKGVLYLYRDPENFEKGVNHMAFLRDHGHRQEVVDRDRCIRIEPALEAVRGEIAGAVYGAADESGDCRLFTQNLARIAEEKGVAFDYDTTVKGLRASGDLIDAVVTDRGELSADNYVLALGSYSPFVVRSLGIKLPIYPVKGYSLTIPIDGHNGAPSVGVIDEDHLVAFACLGDRLRATATAEFTGYDTSHKADDFKAMLRIARGLFPEGGDYDKPEYFACLRPMTPDGPPVLGKGRHRNLFFNTGHGHIGWTMACGSARVVADIISGRKPDIDLKGLTFPRPWAP